MFRKIANKLLYCKDTDEESNKYKRRVYENAYTGTLDPSIIPDEEIVDPYEEARRLSNYNERDCLVINQGTPGLIRVGEGVEKQRFKPEQKEFYVTIENPIAYHNDKYRLVEEQQARVPHTFGVRNLNMGRGDTGIVGVPPKEIPMETYADGNFGGYIHPDFLVGLEAAREKKEKCEHGNFNESNHAVLNYINDPLIDNKLPRDHRVKLLKDDEYTYDPMICHGRTMEMWGYGNTREAMVERARSLYADPFTGKTGYSQNREHFSQDLTNMKMTADTSKDGGITPMSTIIEKKSHKKHYNKKDKNRNDMALEKLSKIVGNSRSKHSDNTNNIDKESDDSMLKFTRDINSNKNNTIDRSTISWKLIERRDIDNQRNGERNVVHDRDFVKELMELSNKVDQRNIHDDIRKVEDINKIRNNRLDTNHNMTRRSTKLKEDFQIANNGYNFVNQTPKVITKLKDILFEGNKTIDIDRVSTRKNDQILKTKMKDRIPSHLSSISRVKDRDQEIKILKSDGYLRPVKSTDGDSKTIRWNYGDSHLSKAYDNISNKPQQNEKFTLDNAKNINVGANNNIYGINYASAIPPTLMGFV